MPFDSREYEYADIKVSILGAELDGFRGLIYDYQQEKSAVYGQGRIAKTIQRGNVSNKGTLYLLKSDADGLNATARASGYRNIIDVPGRLIVITCVYQKEDSPDRLNIDSLIYVEFTSFEDGMKQGDLFKEIELPFIFLDLKQV